MPYINPGSSDEGSEDIFKEELSKGDFIPKTLDVERKSHSAIVTLKQKKFILLHKIREEEYQQFIQEYPIYVIKQSKWFENNKQDIKKEDSGEDEYYSEDEENEEKENEKNEHYYNVMIGRGEGSGGVVRLGQEIIIENGQEKKGSYVAIKKVEELPIFSKSEINIREGIFNQMVLQNEFPDEDIFIRTFAIIKARNEKNKTKVYQVLELADLDGKRVIQAMKELPDKEREILQSYITRRCLYILSLLHSKKILHRDVKPENLFFMLSGVIKIGDFGSAKMDNIVVNDLSDSKYFPPERYVLQWKNIPPDLIDLMKREAWAAGLTLLEFHGVDLEAPTLDMQLQGEPDQKRSYLDILKFIEDKNPPSHNYAEAEKIFSIIIPQLLAQLPPYTNSAIQNIIAGLLQPNPSQRMLTQAAYSLCPPMDENERVNIKDIMHTMKDKLIEIERINDQQNENKSPYSTHEHFSPGYSSQGLFSSSGANTEEDEAKAKATATATGKGEAKKIPQSEQKKY